MATRAEVFGFARNTLSASNSESVSGYTFEMVNNPHNSPDEPNILYLKS